MKRLVVVLSSLLVLPAFAEVAPSYYDNDMVFSDVELDDVDTGEVETDTVADTESESGAVKKQNTVSGRSANSRIAAGRTTANRSTRTPATRSNTVRSRSISVRSNATPVRTTSVSTRRASNASTTNSTTRRGTTARAATLTTSSSPLYYPNTVQSRTGGVSTRGASISARNSAMRAATVASTPVTTAEAATETTTELNTMKSLTEYCQAQYASCMDNYCNVLDDNQGRCTCSKNIKSYEKTEAALQSATEALQDVARSIQYIGLSADQISTLFTETEAELQMKSASSKDNSAIRSSLDKVRKMIVDVKAGTASTTENTAVNFDLSGLLDFNLDSTGFDLSSFLGTSSNTNSISNQRGESLYKTATARCKASVLNSCTAQGVDAAVITNSYDLEIDKSCLAYERALTDSNTQMAQTVANAKEVLKKARLMVAQNKNSYDLRGCVSALETCMQDDYVCGTDYENCLDPTGQFIVNGSVVVGSMPGNNTAGSIPTRYSHDNLFSTWNVSSTNAKNPWKTIDSNNSDYITLVDYINETVTSTAAQNSSDKMSAYLQHKIGYHVNNNKDNKDYGMCMSVLNKCQDYTYDSKGKYNPQNQVIKQFLQRALVQIKMSQDELLASYAEDCINDVSSCLSSNNYDATNPDNTKSRTAINACYSQIRTCLSVNGNIFGNVDSDELKTWVTGTYGSLETVEDDDQLEAVCNQISEDDCDSTTKAYCLNRSSGTGTVLTGACTWNGTKCTKNTSCN